MDIADPDIPAGTTRRGIAKGIENTLADMRSRGWRPAFCSILPDAGVESTIADHLFDDWDCVVIGGGIRVPASQLQLFERVVNAVRANAPDTPIAFNTSPEDTAEAAARWLDRI